jgi:hypothetical protein
MAAQAWGDTLFTLNAPLPESPRPTPASSKFEKPALQKPRPAAHMKPFVLAPLTSMSARRMPPNVLNAPAEVAHNCASLHVVSKTLKPCRSRALSLN